MRSGSAIIAAYLVALFGVDAGAQAVSVPTPQPISSEQFAKLQPIERRRVFDTLPADARARLVREHARSWVERNRQRLDGTEVAALEDVIESVTSELVDSPMKAAPIVTSKTRCWVSQSVLAQAFDVFGARQRDVAQTMTYLERAKCWVSWGAEFLALPTRAR